MRRHLQVIGIFVTVLIVVLSMNWTPANAGTSAVDIGDGGLSSPCGVAVDGAGNVYVLDTNHHLVKKLAAGGNTWEDITHGQVFGSIYGIAIDGSGNLYVADSSNERVMKLASGGSSWTSIVPPGGSGINLAPQYVAADPAGIYLYVADLQGSACRIWKVTLATNTWTDITNGAGLPYVYGLTVDGSGNVYATQNPTQQPKVVKLVAGASSWTAVMPWGVTANTYGIAVDTTGNLYVSSDYYLYVMPQGGGWTRLSPYLAQANHGITVDGAGNIYVARSDGKVTKITQTPPTMTSTYPANGASNVLANKPITVTFSDPIVAGTNFSSIALWRNLTTAVSCTREISGNQLIITPDGGLVGGSSYSVVVPPDAVSFLNPLATGFNFGFTVAVPVAPTVTSSAASNLTATTASLNGSVDSDGGANTTEYGFYWGTTDSTTTRVQVGGYSYGGAFTTSLGGLTSGATYYFKAYATNSVGTTYGALQSFTTPVLPTVTSSDASGISGSDATLNGNIMSNGGAAITDYGFYWGTDVSAMTKVQVGTDNRAGAFTKGLTGLSAATAYYFKTYATNAVGTAFSAPLSFTTKVPTTTTVVGEGAAPYGQPVTITAIVTSSSGAPQGTVTFNDGASTIGMPVTLLNGSATLTSSVFGIGTHDINVVYTPDGSGPHSGSSGSTTQTIQSATSGVTLQSSNLNTTYGDSVTFMANVTGVSYTYATPTGTVTFKDGATTLGTVTLSGGTATFTTNTLTAGTHSVSASYTPATAPADPYFAASNSVTLTQKVAKATPTVTLTRTTGPAASVTGEAVGFTAQVTAQVGPGPSGGTLTVTIGTRPPLTHDLALGSTFLVSEATLTPNTYTVTASYGGDANYTAADATPLSQTVIKANTTTVLATGNSPSVVGQKVTFTASVAPVTPGSGSATGNVTFYRDGVSIGSAAVDPVQGKASIDLTFDHAGSYQMTAAYGGDGSYNGSNASAVAQSVGKAPTTTVLVSSQNPTVFGQAVTLTATVAAAAPGAGAPDGTVTFYDGASTLGVPVTLNGSGQASLTTGTLAVGDHSVTAAYSGGSDYSVSSSPVLTQAVSQASTVLVVTSDRNPARWSDSVAFTVTVSASAPGAGIPSGQVTLTGDGLSLTANLTGGHAQVTIAALNVSAGTTMTATYGGDSNFTGSSGTLTQIVNQAASSTTLSASPVPSVFGQAVTLTVAVAPVAPATETPSGGTVTFYEGATELGSASLLDGSASLSIPALSVGAHNIRAVYSGAAHYAGSTSADVAQRVDKAGTTVSLVSDKDAPTYGDTVTLTATVGAAAPGSGTPTGTVTFYDGGTALESPVSLNGGSTSLTVSSGVLSAGSHTLTVAYSGDSNFSQPAQPGSLALTVGKATVGIAVTSPVSGEYDSTVSLVAGLTPSVTGKEVHFLIYRTADGATTSAEIGTTTTTAGTATLSYKIAVPAGDYTFVASFPGDGDIAMSTQSGTLTVTAKPATLTVQSGLAAPHLGDVTLSATLSPAVAGKTVSFTVGGSASGSGTTDAAGKATCTYHVVKPVGTWTIAASFASDGILASASGSADLAVTQTAGALTVGDATSNPDTIVTLTATLSPAEAGHAVAFTVDGTLVGEGTTDSVGVATLSYTAPRTAMGYAVSASWAGNADITAATGSATLTVRDVPPVFDLTNYPLPDRSDTEGKTVTGLAAHAVDPNGDTVTYSATGLPSGISIDASTGAITGNIAGDAAGTYTVTIGATDSAANVASRTFVWKVSRESTASTGSPPPGTPPTTTTTGNTTTVSTTAEASTDSTGKATATVTQTQVNEALTQALANASQQGEGTQVKIEIKVEAPANTASVETRIPEAAVAQVAEGGTNALTVSTPVASITFDSKTLSTISGAASGDVKVTAAKVDATALPSDTQQAIGDRPVFNFSVMSGSRTISQFGGSVEVAVPYTPKPGEDTNAIVIYYVDAQGKLQIVANCAYDPVSGAVVFSTNHFSQYAVGYNKVTFHDVAAGAWYAGAVDFVAARGITTGSGDGSFNPDSKLTRGQFLVMVMRAYAIAPDENPQDNFADAGNTYYSGYLAAAKRLGISSGVGNNCYAPDRQISRQEMFTLLYNSLKLIGQLPAATGAKSLADFTDASRVAPWAHDAMAALVASGTVGGSDGMLMPSGTTSRAQMAQVLYNLLAK